MFAVPHRRSRICIVGAGAGGLSALRIFQQRADLWDPVVFDERKAVGGVWYVFRPSWTLR